LEEVSIGLYSGTAFAYKDSGKMYYKRSRKEILFTWIGSAFSVPEHLSYILHINSWYCVYLLSIRGVSTYHIQYYHHKIVVTQNNSQLLYLVQHSHKAKWLNSHISSTIHTVSFQCT